MNRRIERKPIHWCEIAEFVRALGFVESFDKGDMIGNLRGRLEKAMAAGLIVHNDNDRTYCLTEKARLDDH